ncbi:BH0509 family protein [Listeria kieliensis]
MTITEFQTKFNDRKKHVQLMINAIAEVSEFKIYELVEMSDKEIEYIYQVKVIEECHN